jgi:hypothetical protein
LPLNKNSKKEHLKKAALAYCTTHPLGLMLTFAAIFK